MPSAISPFGKREKGYTRKVRHRIRLTHTLKKEEEKMRRTTISALSLIALFLFSIAFTYPAFSATVQLPQTGQTKCYDTAYKETGCAGTGQDGDIRAGIEWPIPRFTVNGECIADNLTGLMWTRDGNLPNSTKNWNDAIDYANSLNNAGFCGYSDWRLPNVNELESLANADKNDSAAWLNTQDFTNVQSSYYWSSTTYAASATFGLIVDMGNGYSPGGNMKDGTLYVWPVRGSTAPPALLWKTGQTQTYRTGDDGAHKEGVAWPSPRFDVPGDGTVIDNLTGLTWTRDANVPGPSPCTPATVKTWQDALNYVACLNSHSYLGYTDWRLPNRKQLLSLIDRSQSEPPLLSGHPFHNVQLNCYWSSTSGEYAPSLAWIACMHGGDFYADYKTKTRPVWPVRNGPAGPTLTVSKLGNGSGTVTSSPAGINCGTICSLGFPKKKKVTLTPAPDSDSVFVGWSGACKGNGTCSVTMTGDITVGATFQPGSCTYGISSKSKTLSYKGGTIKLAVTASGYTYCAAPDVTVDVKDSEWITYTAGAFVKNKGSITIPVPAYEYSAGRTGTIAIWESTFAITQTGMPCTFTLNPTSSDLFPAAGDTGTFTITATPTDCPWTTMLDKKSATWITIDSGGSGTGTGPIGYTVALNDTKKPRNGKITVTVAKKSKSYTVKQDK